MTSGTNGRRYGWEKHFITGCVGVLTTVVSAGTIGGAVWAMQMRDAVKAIPEIQQQLAALADGQRASEARDAEFAARLKIANPTLAVPDPRDPSKTLGK